MRRLIWTGLVLTVGVGAGLGLAWWAYRRFDAARRAVSADGIVNRVDQAVGAARQFADEVRQAAAAREAELRRTLLKPE